MAFVKQSFTGYLIGIMCIGVAIAAALLLNSKVTLTCARALQSTSQCELKATGPLERQTQQFRLNDLTGATVERNVDFLRKRGNRNRYRVILQTKTGPIPLTSGYTSEYNRQQRTAEEITAFVKNRSDPMLKIVQDDRWFGYLFGGIFGTVGLLLLSGKTRRLFGF